MLSLIPTKLAIYGDHAADPKPNDFSHLHRKPVSFGSIVLEVVVEVVVASIAARVERLLED